MRLRRFPGRWGRPGQATESFRTTLRRVGTAHEDPAEWLYSGSSQTRKRRPHARSSFGRSVDTDEWLRFYSREMEPRFGTYEIAIQWPDGREERLPHALLREAHSSLPEDRESLRGRIAAWTRARPDGAESLSDEDLEGMEAELLEAVHSETSDFGLLSHIAFRADGQLVNPNAAGDDWPSVRAPFVLALAIRRLRVLQLALGTNVRFVDVDPIAR